jgi:hypothetical protein
MIRIPVIFLLSVTAAASSLTLAAPGGRQLTVSASLPVMLQDSVGTVANPTNWQDIAVCTNLTVLDDRAVFYRGKLLTRTVSIAWDPAADPAVAGYKIYSGPYSRNYTCAVDVGSVTSAVITVTNVTPLTWFAATTYSADPMIESDFSNELVVTNQVALAIK